MSKSFRAFVFISALLFLGNLFFGNGLMQILDPWEADFLRYASASNDITSLPALIQQHLINTFGPDTNYLRLSGLGMLLFALFAFISLARPLFGRETLLAFFLVVAASPILVFTMKLAIPDTWLAGVQLISIPLLLRTFKQDDWLWSIGFGLMTLVGAACHAPNTLTWMVVWLLSLALLHPEGKKIWNLKFWWPLPFVIAQVIWLSPGNGWLFYWGNLHPVMTFVALFSMGIIWMGFLVGGLRDLIWKIGKKEEASLLLCCWFLAATATFSLTLGMFFCLLIAKQLQLFFKTNYPWSNWVKSPAIITLIFYFLFAVALVFNNYESFGKGALTYTFVVIGLFWATALWAVIGIFSRDRSWIIGSKTFTGLVPLFVGIVLLLPFWEKDNTWQTRLLTKEIPTYLEKQDINWNGRLYLPADWASDKNAALMAELSGWQLSEQAQAGNLALFPVTEETDKKSRAEAFRLWVPASQTFEQFYLQKMN